MKKIFLVVLILLSVAVSLVACVNSEEKLVGRWELVSHEEILAGVRTNIMDFSEQTFEFFSDGSGEVSSDYLGEQWKSDFTWTAEGNRIRIYERNEVLICEYNISGSNLTLTLNDGWHDELDEWVEYTIIMTFRRAAASVGVGWRLADGEDVDLTGIWNLVSFDFNSDVDLNRRNDIHNQYEHLEWQFFSDGVLVRQSQSSSRKIDSTWFAEHGRMRIGGSSFDYRISGSTLTIYRISPMDIYAVPGTSFLSGIGTAVFEKKN
jgi:hypothetical protein